MVSSSCKSEKRSSVHLYPHRLYWGETVRKRTVVVRKWTVRLIHTHCTEFANAHKCPTKQFEICPVWATLRNTLTKVFPFFMPANLSRAASYTHIANSSVFSKSSFVILPLRYLRVKSLSVKSEWIWVGRQALWKILESPKPAIQKIPNFGSFSIIFF